MRRLLIKALAPLLLIVALVCLGLYGYLRRSLPVVEGTIRVPGISDVVEIVRDGDAVPHIFAATKLDALYGLGYVHAQDRLWQMEFQRRIGWGRLSEIFGAVVVPQDRFLRTVGFGRAAQAAWDRLSPDARPQVEAYVAGVNAFITGHHGSALPPEFSLLRFEPEKWTGPDVLVWVKMMAWDLSMNYSLELMRREIASRVGLERLAELTPPYADESLSILSASSGSQRVRTPFSQARQTKTEYDPLAAGDSSSFSALVRSLPNAGGMNDLLLGARTEALGSNNWVVDGTLTASGKPLLANDPHLATHIPSLWYLAHMKAGDFDVIGATLPGTPAVAIGRNRSIAWGETNLGADVEDLYRERLDATGSSAEFRGVQEPLRIVGETIKVKDAAPVRVDVRISRHGPLISDAINANNAEAKTSPRPEPIEPLALRWSALDDNDQSLAAFLRLNASRNWTDFTGALSQLSAPAQNFVYADVDGHIGYYAPGRIPVRTHGDGSMPVEGWTGDAEWASWIPFEELPHAFDPPEHFIVTANNRPLPPPYPHLIALEYPEPYRAQRITDLIRQRKGLTPDDFRAFQSDTLSLHARALLPLLLRHVHPQDAADRSAVNLLRGWNYDARGDSPAAAVFETWFLRLAPGLVADELGPVAFPSYRGRFSYITRFVMNTLTGDRSPWCDDVSTPGEETCDDIVTIALHDATAMLTRQLGGDIQRWRWNSVHRVVFPHQGLDAVGLLRPLLSRSIPNGGDWSTIDVGPVDTDHPLEQRAIPGYRQIVDLSATNDSRFLDAVGESGHFLSPHYDNWLQDWRDVRYRRMRMERGEIEQGAIGRLRLVPLATLKSEVSGLK